MKVELLAFSGNDLLVVNAARTSFGKHKTEFDAKDAKLIHYLAREKHLLPFRHPTITLRCNAPIFIARQLGKHQAGMSWSEESRRYIKTAPEFFSPETWRKAAENVKQGSSDEAVEIINVDGGNGTPQQFADAALRGAVFAYNSMLNAGVAPELARTVLPQSMMINWVWTGTLLAWNHMVRQRTEAGAQKEVRDFAFMVENVIAPLYPVSWEALRRHE